MASVYGIALAAARLLDEGFSGALKGVLLLAGAAFLLDYAINLSQRTDWALFAFVGVALWEAFSSIRKAARARKEKRGEE